MSHHHFRVIIFIIILGASLHAASQGLSGKLSHLFPNLAREIPPAEAPLPEPVIETVASPTDSPVASMEEQPPSPISLEEILKKTKPENLPRSPKETSLHDRQPRFSRRLVPLTTPVELPPLSHDRSPASFAIPPVLEPIVDFWRKVYGIYDTQHVIIHDMEDLGIQYSVLDFTHLNKKGISDTEKRSIREAEVSGEIRRIQGILRKLGEGASYLSPEAARIARLFQVNDLDQFNGAIERVRSQTGLRDRYLEGLQRSGRYMPFFEAIFQSYGIPREISRLAFVESLFRERAYSKVGAAGLWQFMPSSAQHYMKVGQLLDERYDPIVATHGAARLLLKNYELLGTWPLAINAYNSGAGNLMKAISKLGTRDIAMIVTRFKGGSYAFASRNFYPSFLAALSVYENREKYFGHVKLAPLMQFETIQLPASMGFSEIAYLSQSTLPELKELNPAFADEVFDGSYAIPAGAQIRIPEGKVLLIPTATSLVKN